MELVAFVRRKKWREGALATRVVYVFGDDPLRECQVSMPPKRRGCQSDIPGSALLPITAVWPFRGCEVELPILPAVADTPLCHRLLLEGGDPQCFREEC